MIILYKKNRENKLNSLNFQEKVSRTSAYNNGIKKGQNPWESNWIRGKEHKQFSCPHKGSGLVIVLGYLISYNSQKENCLFIQRQTIVWTYYISSNDYNKYVTEKGNKQ